MSFGQHEFPEHLWDSSQVDDNRPAATPVYSDEDHGRAYWNQHEAGFQSWKSTPVEKRPAVRFRVKIMGREERKVLNPNTGKLEHRYPEETEQWTLQLQEWLPRARYGFLLLWVRPAGWHDMRSTNFSPWGGCMGASSRDEAEEKAGLLLDAQLEATRDLDEMTTMYYEREE